MKKFINCTNHPSTGWNRDQMKEAEKYGQVVDYPFPRVLSDQTDEELDRDADEVVKEMLTMSPATVLCQGDFVMTYKLILRLKENNIKVMAAYSDREVVEKLQADGSVMKKTIFRFAGFREYT